MRHRWDAGWSWIGVVPITAALSLVLMVFAPLSSGERSTSGDGVGWSRPGVVGWSRPGVVPSAHAARTVSLNETGHLHLTSKHNYTLNEQGTASGTAPGAIYVHLTAVSTSRVTAEINIYPHGGSLTGAGTASYRRMGATASFSGSMSIARGSGRYAHAHGSGLSFSGTIAESSNDAITVHVSGRVSD